MSTGMRGRHGHHARGSRTGRWNGGRIVSSHGYVKLRVGRSHPLADPNGYAYEHRLVLAAAGVEVPVGFVIHHLNHDKTDNRMENLAVLPRGDHSREHDTRQRDSLGRFVRKHAAGRELDGRMWDEFPAAMVGVAS
jgi:hypothetical protein